MFDPRMVRTSTPGGIPNRSSDGSYPRSMRRHGLSDRQDITRRVDIAVLVSPAPWTGPSAHTQRERVQQMSTGGTQFAAWKPSVDLDDRDAGRLRFGFNHADRGANRGVREGTGKAVVLNHATDVQVFEENMVESTGQHRTEFMQAIASGIGNLFMQPRHTAGLRETTVRPLLLSGQSPLGTRQQGGPSKEMFGIGHGLPVREGRQATEAKIDADRLAGLDASDGGLDLDDHRDVVATGWMTRDRHRAGIGRHRPTETQFQHPELGERQPLRDAIETKRAPGIFGAVPHSALLLERGVGAAFGEEIGEGGLQVTKGLLKWNAGHLIEEGQFRIALESGQSCAGTHKRQSFTTLEGDGARGQHAVVDQAATAKRLSQVFGLRGSGIRSECPTAFHGSITNHLASEVKSPRTTRFLPALNGGVSARVAR